MFRGWAHNVAQSLMVVLGLAATPVAAQDVHIEWQVANRFAPFEVFGPREADRLFRAYRLRPGEDFEDWHARLDLALDGGMASPYETALREGRALHWDPVAGRHRDPVLAYVKNEGAAKVRVRMRLAADDGHDLSGETCLWEFASGTVPCTEPVETEIPLTGGEVSVVVGDYIHHQTLTPEHTVIVGMGDSYASGEGNPDVPATWRSTRGATDYRFLNDAAARDPLPARKWIDDRCHRSFFSFQSLTALRIASENPRSFVSFLHYACSGAEVFDGLLAPQKVEVGSVPFLEYSQVNQAVQELCTSPVAKVGSAPREEYEDITPGELGGINVTDFDRRPYDGRFEWKTELALGDDLDRKLREYRSATGKSVPSSGFMACPDGAIRQPDILLLSIGGNDVGFADLVSYALLPAQYDSGVIASFTLPNVCPPPGPYRADPARFPDLAEHCLNQDRRNWPNAGDLIYGRDGMRGRGGVAQRLALATNVLEYRLGVSPDDIFMTQYPDPLRVLPTNTPVCAPLDERNEVIYGVDPAQDDEFSAWNGLKVAAPADVIVRDWELDLNPEEGHKLLGVFDNLRVELARAAKAQGINMICETRDAFVGSGWWRGEHLNLPNAGPAGNPRQWDVADWHAYAYDPMDRSIRTGNDSALTQPDPGTTIMGAVHPNLTGHRLLAEAVHDRISQEVAKRRGFSLERIGDFLQGLD